MALARTIEIINDGTTYNLSDGTITYDVTLDGLGIPPVSRNLLDIAMKHGQVDNGFRLKSRTMVLTLYYSVATEAAADAKRDQMYEIFWPSLQPMTLRLTRADASVREISCYLNGSVDMSESDRTGYDQRFVVPLISVDPAWYDPTEVNWYPDITIRPAFEYQYISYGGSWMEYPVIYFTGELESPSIGAIATTLTGTTSYGFTINETIPSGETWIADLRYGKKTLVDATYHSRLDAIGALDFTLLRIEKDGQAWYCSCASKDSSAEVKVTYNNRYLGA